MAAVTFEELEAIIEEEGETLIVDVRSQAEFSQVYRCNMAITGSKSLLDNNQQVFAGKDSVQCLHSSSHSARRVSDVARSVSAEVWGREAGTSRRDHCHLQVNTFWISLLFSWQFGSSAGLEDAQQRVVSSFTVSALSRLHIPCLGLVNLKKKSTFQCALCEI